MTLSVFNLFLISYFRQYFTRVSLQIVSFVLTVFLILCKIYMEEKLMAMDKTEEIACRFFKYKGYQDIKYEPDGNVSPDFLLNDEIAVEVRRLNQNITNKNGVIEGLEIIDYSLFETIRNVLNLFGPAINGDRWIVSYMFERPIAENKKIKKELEKLLESFNGEYLEEILKCGLKIIIKKINNLHQPNGLNFDATSCDKEKKTQSQAQRRNRFNLGMVLDMDSGGSLLELYERNIKICLSDKEDKTAKMKKKYAKCWLVLVDKIGYGLEDCEVDMVLKRLEIEHDWDKLIVLATNGSNKAFEL